MTLRRHLMRETGLHRTDPRLPGHMRARLERGRFLADFLGQPGFLDRAFPSEIHKAWARAFGEENVRVFLFEELVETPGRVIDETTAFPGGGPADPAATRAVLDVLEATTSNRKAPLAKVDMPEACRDRLVALFAEELRASRAAFGPRVDAWCRRYGVG